VTAAGSILIALAVLVAAVAVDLLLIWAWRQRRRRRGDAPPAREPGDPPWFRASVDGVGRLVGRIDRAASGFIAIVRSEWPHDDLGRLRLALAVGCIVLTASIGYAYAGSTVVAGWQLWTWLVATIVAVAALLPSGPGRPGWSREAWIVLGLTVLGGVLRMAALDKIPPGLHGDESKTAEFTLIQVFPAGGLTISPFRTGLHSQPTLFNYIVWLSLRLAGPSMVGLRLPSAIAGTLAIPCVYFAVSQFSGKRVALFSAALLTTYHYHIHWSRLALNNIWDTVWIPLIVGLFAWAWSRKWSGGAVLAGVALGLSQYFYAGSKIAIFLLAYLAVSLWRRERDSHRMVVFGAKLLAAAAVVAGPIALFAVREPALYASRTASVLYWAPGLREGLGPFGLAWLEAVRDQFIRAAAGFTSLTDTTGFYRSSVPLVMGLAAPLFLAGIIWAFVRRQFLPLIWLGLTMFFGGFLLTYTPSSSHYVAAIPAVAWLVAMILDALGSHVRPWLAVALLAAIMLTDVAYYFGVYIPSGPAGDLNMPFPTGQPR
jgi:hypothetical protein